MKSSLRWATLFLSDSIPRPYGRVSYRTVAPILLLPVLLLLPLTAEAGLPRVAISIPTDQSFALGLRAAEQCDGPGKIIVLPPLSFYFGANFGGGENLFRLLEEQSIQSAPQASEIWLQVVVQAGLLSGKESEQEIT